MVFDKDLGVIVSICVNLRKVLVDACLWIVAHNRRGVNLFSIPRFAAIVIILLACLPYLSVGQDVKVRANRIQRGTIGQACQPEDVRTTASGEVLSCQGGFLALSGAASTPDATATTKGKAVLGAKDVTTIAGLGVCAAGNVGQTKLATDGKKSPHTCRNTTGATYAWVEDNPVAEVANYGIISDGVTNQTSALVTLFTGTLSSYAGEIHIPYNTLFDPMTVYAAVPASARLDDDSVINWGQPPTYTTKAKKFVWSDTTANDSALSLVSTHHPTLILNNTRTSGSSSALLARSSILFAAGRTQTGDDLLTGYIQLAKKQSLNVWGLQVLRQSKWLAVNGAIWAASTVYSAGSYVRSGTYYYSTVAGGTSGATAPVHTSGSASDGGVTWVYQGAINDARLLFELDEDGRLGIGTQADNTVQLTVAEAGTTPYTQIAYTNANNSSQIYETRSAKNSSGTVSTILTTTNGDGLTAITNASTPIFEYSTSRFYSSVPFVAGNTFQANGNLTSGVSTDGGSHLLTLQGYATNGANGIYGRMLFNANPNYTGDARRWLVTNAVSSFRIIRSVDATTTPTIDSAGAVTSGVETLSINKDGALALVSATSSAFAVGANGATNPQLQVDASTSSVATGLKITGAAAGSGVALAAISSGTNENISIAGKGTGGVIIGSGGTAITKILSATASLDFGATAAGTCDALTITVTGAADGDVVQLGIPTALAGADAYQSFWGYVSAADTVTVKRCNLTNVGTALSNPSAATVRVTVTKH